MIISWFCWRCLQIRSPFQAPYQTSQASVWERPIQLFYIQAVAAVRAEGSCSSVSWPLYICMILSPDSLLLLGSCWLARLRSSWQPALPLCPSRYEKHSLFLKAQVWWRRLYLNVQVIQTFPVGDFDSLLWWMYSVASSSSFSATGNPTTWTYC